LASDVKSKKKEKINENSISLIFNLFLTWASLLNYTQISYFNIQNAFWNNMYLSNNLTIYLYFLVIIIFCILLAGLYMHNQQVSFTAEYLIFVFLIILLSFFLVSSTNLFLTILLFEFVGLLIFGKFTTGVVFLTEKELNTRPNPNVMLDHFSYVLFNSLFFQFWVNFISSILLFYALINIHYLFGFSNFFLLNFFFAIISLNWYIPEGFNTFTLTVLTTGFLIKLGFAPYQFFKIEIYRGVPLYMVIVYTTLYLIVYVYVFFILFIIQMPMFRDFVGTYILISLTFSAFYIVNLLFDTKNFKAFLSYSTLIVVLNLFIVFLII